MSIYSLFCQENPDAKILKSWLNLDTFYFKTGEYRDIYLNKKGNLIILYTRNNYPGKMYLTEVIDSLVHHPEFRTMYPDLFDKTYIYFVFDVPRAYKAKAKEMKPGSEPLSITKKLDRAARSISNMTIAQQEIDPRVIKVKEVFAKKGIRSGNPFIDLTDEEL